MTSDDARPHHAPVPLRHDPTASWQGWEPNSGEWTIPMRAMIEQLHIGNRENTLQDPTLFVWHATLVKRPSTTNRGERLILRAACPNLPTERNLRWLNVLHCKNFCFSKVSMYILAVNKLPRKSGSAQGQPYVRKKPTPLGILA
jgi:hypothetical protein